MRYCGRVAVARSKALPGPDLADRAQDSEQRQRRCGHVYWPASESQRRRESLNCRVEMAQLSEAQARRQLVRELALVARYVVLVPRLRRGAHESSEERCQRLPAALRQRTTGREARIASHACVHYTRRVW